MGTKPVRFSAHAAAQMQFRGASSEEVRAAIAAGDWREAERGRLEARQVFAYEAAWNGKLYDFKQVRPIFVETEHEIVVVTVYTYYYNEVDQA